MSFNEITIPAYYLAVKLMFSNKPVKEGMNELGRLARQLVPHPVWDKLGAIDFAGEQAGLQAWISQEIAGHPQDVSILSFCLSDLGDELTLYFLRQAPNPKQAPVVLLHHPAF